MTTINKGIFSQKDLYERAVGNDWPVAQVISTSSITEIDNLYYTNSRVLTAITPVLTSSNVAETDNLYYTNARVLSAVNPVLTTANVVELNNLFYTDGRVQNYLNQLGVVPYSNIISNISVELGTNLSGNTTTDLAEGINLYYTNARVQAYFDVAGIESSANIIASIDVGMDLSGNTTTDLAEGDNLYYTNTRVQAYLDTEGYSAGGGGGGDLSGNTTSDLAEGTNLYFTNARVRSAFFSGAGISISPTGIISNDNAIGVYNTGIDVSVPKIATSNYSNIITFSTAETTNRFIVRSLHVTNISDSLAHINANISYADGNSLTYANAIPLPVGASFDIIKNPEVFQPGDSLNIQGLNSTLSPTSGVVSAILTYQTIIDNEAFFGTGRKITTANSNVLVISADTAPVVLESIKIVNNEGNDVTAKIIWADETGNAKSYIGYNLPVPKNSAVETITFAKKLDSTDKLYVECSGAINDHVSVFLNGIGTSSFTYISELSNVDVLRGSPIFITLETTEPDGTSIYYETVPV